MSASGWSEKFLEDICTVKGGKRLPAGHSLQDEPTDHPYIKSRDIRGGKVSAADLQYLSGNTFDKIKRYIVNTDDVCITIVANIGDVGVVPSGLDGANLTENAVKLAKLSREVDSRFLGALLSHPQYKAYMEQLSAGAAQAKLGIYKIRRIKVRFPPLSTQRKIAAILTAYDDLIETNKRRIALLEKMAEEIYREWFVRMRFPGYRNTRLVRGVPKNWDHKQFGRFCMLKRGYDLPNALVEDGPYPVVASTSITTFHKHYKVEPPVITTGRSGSLGDVLMTQSPAWPLNTSLYVRDFFGNSPYLVFYTLKSMGLEKFNSGAGVPTLNRNHLNGIPIAVPDKNLQQRFEEFVEPLHQQAEGFRVANYTLAETRDLLLPRLISGKLSVEDLQIQFPPSMQETA